VWREKSELSTAEVFNYFYAIESLLFLFLKKQISEMSTA